MAKRETPARRNLVARGMISSPTFRPRIVRAAKGKGAYTRKGRVPRGVRPFSLGGYPVLDGGGGLGYHRGLSAGNPVVC